MTISLDLLKLETEPKIFQRGEEFYEENSNNQLSFLQNNQNISITAEIKEYACKLEYNLESGTIMNKVCTCYYFESNNKICKHVITLAFQINHKLKKTIKNIDLLDSYEKADQILNNIIELNSNISNDKTNIDQAQTVSQITGTIKSLLEENSTLTNI